MKEFEVSVIETLKKNITVEATSAEEAQQMVVDMYRNADIILDSDDFIGVDYEVDSGNEIEKAKTMEVLLVEPGQYAKMTTIGAELTAMQKAVEGHIQAVYFFDEPVALICNDEAKINGSELNRAIKDKDGKVLDIVSGTFFVCGISGDNFTSLPPKYQAKFEKLFKNPEAFLKLGRSIMSIPTKPVKKTEQKENKSHGQEL